jgi:hypothetical protein
VRIVYQLQKAFIWRNPSSHFHSKFVTQHKCQGLQNTETQHGYLSEKKKKLDKFQNVLFCLFFKNLSNHIVGLTQ